MKGTGAVLRLNESGVAPNTPPAAHSILYVKADGRVYSKDDTGRERVLYNSFDQALTLNAGVSVANYNIIQTAGRAVSGSGHTARLPLIPSMDMSRVYWYRPDGISLALTGNFGDDFTFTAGTGGINASAGAQNINIGTIYDLISQTRGSMAAASGVLHQLRWQPIVRFKVFLATSVTSTRNFVMLVNSAFANTMLDADTPTANGFGFRFSTNAADAGWIPFNYDGVLSTGAAIGTVAANTDYVLQFRYSLADGKTYFSVDGSAETALSTNIPSTSLDLVLFAGNKSLSGGREFYIKSAEVIIN